MAKFVSELRSLAELCNFGASLDDMLRDRLICGINNSKIQQKLLAEKLTLTTAIEMAQGMETAAKNAKEIAQQDSASNSESVHRVMPPTRGKDTGRNRSKFTGTCFCCGRVGHKHENCLKDATCHGCGKTGHIQRVCRSKPATQRKNKLAGKRPVHHLKGSPEESSNDSSEDYDLYMITSSSKPKPYRVDIVINDKPTKMEIDNWCLFNDPV